MADDDVPGVFEGVGQAVDVHGGDGDDAAPAEEEQEPAVAPGAHDFAGAGEMEEGEHGEGEYEAEDDLAQVYEVGDAAAAADADDENGGDDGEEAGDHAA